MVKQLEAIFDRLGRAEEHLETIKRELLSYYDDGRCVITGEYKPDEGRRKGTIENAQVAIPEIDTHLNTLIGEFLHNLRSGLDHLAWQLVLNTKKTPTSDTKFPILGTAPTPNKKGERKPPTIYGGVSDAAQTLIGASQPYQWGDRYAEHSLFLLHRLWNIDKHRHVIARGCHTAITLPMGLPQFKFSCRLTSTNEHGAQLILVPDDPEVDVNAKTTVQVAIYEPEHSIERPLLRTLEEMLKAVDGVIDAAQTTCF